MYVGKFLYQINKDCGHNTFPQNLHFQDIQIKLKTFCRIKLNFWRKTRHALREAMVRVGPPSTRKRTTFTCTVALLVHLC